MDAPFDRGEVDRASLDATERLRARLSGRPLAPEKRPGRSILPWVIASLLFVFLAGLIANPWFERSVRSRLPFAGVAVVEPAAEAEVAALEQRLRQLEARTGPADAPVPVERLARTEAQIETGADQLAREAERIDGLTGDVAGLAARLDADRERAEVATATANAAASRAQAMLVLVIARRTVDAGRPFGTLDPALRRSFEDRYPDAVKAITALGAAPVSLAILRSDFNAMRPAIGAAPIAPPRQTWWDALTGTISSAVSRPADSAVAAAPDAAAAALARGDIAGAAAQLRRLPSPRPAALSNWLAAYDRLQAGSQALAMLEAAMVLPPPEPITEAPPAR
ncbi:hypothetical protein GCM10011529_16060 [Polymorphobacter glacialis]|uniref:Uncharacterized protein n=1 Tax=Sandarakinorhabdus glacialis TaxID=1614636 RepID=A0A916ZSI9_9SPHN|nr:hypothetical protein [Polymorphobacter glacialis]GGE10454.1 hypothetical protein GCM10011529_16060 [Polymorphobacter glacialis]